jgi:hypothetical protein
MDRGLKIDAGYEAVPSPQWVKDRSGVGNTGNRGPTWFAGVLSGFSSSVDKRDIGRKSEVGGGVELLVNMKKTSNGSL